MKMTSGKRALDKIYKRRNRYEIPEWQRGEVWPLSKKQMLIDSILRDWKLPKFYFLRTNNEPETFDVVDGQQRLSAIFEFFDNELSLAPESATKFGASLYKELEDSFSDKFDDFEIEFDIIEDGGEEEVKEFFQRLQEGLQLTSSEKLNSLHSNVRDFAFELANHQFFKTKIAVSNKRFGLFDIACKAAVIEIDGLDAGTRFEDMKAVFESYASHPKDSKSFLRLRKALEILNIVVDQKFEGLQSRALVQSVITLFSRFKYDNLDENKDIAILKRFLIHFLNQLEKQVELGNKATDQDYLDFQRTMSANTKAGVRVRHEILIRKLITFDPSLSGLLGPDQILESNLRVHHGKLAEAIQKQIKTLNDKYSAIHGKDLFKMTNQTVPALQKIGIPVEDETRFKELTEDLYFLFRESIGQRFDKKLPPSFVNINLIRTGLEHDVDHGKEKDVQKKKMSIAGALEAYSTKRSLPEFDQMTFQVFQANILSAILRDLLAIDVKVLGAEASV